MPVGMTFDGTTHVCKALIILLQHVDDGVTKQRVCQLILPTESITGEEVVRQLVTALSTELSNC